VVLMSQIPANLLAFIKSAEVPVWLVILMINIFLIILGGPLEAITILVITLPILYPLVTGLGFSGIWFAVIMMINMELALISPPEGLNLFILQDLAKASANEVSRGVIPLPCGDCALSCPDFSCARFDELAAGHICDVRAFPFRPD
jgi:C4-dicarboxylate transporter, DctM subunit